MPSGPSLAQPAAATAPHAELMRLMEAAGFDARVALQRKADEEILTILHFRRRQGTASGQAGQQGQQAGGQQLEQPSGQPLLTQQEQQERQQRQQRRQQDSPALQAGRRQQLQQQAAEQAAVGADKAPEQQLAGAFAATLDLLEQPGSCHH